MSTAAAADPTKIEDSIFVRYSPYVAAIALTIIAVIVAMYFADYLTWGECKKTDDVVAKPKKKESGADDDESTTPVSPQRVATLENKINNINESQGE